MGFKIISPEERMAEKRHIKGVILGSHGVGKTSLLNTFPDPSKVLFLNLEAGDLSVQDWPGVSININTWEQARDLACLTGGPDPAAMPVKGAPQIYGAEHYQYVQSENQGLAELLKNSIEILFWDSISVASRLCFRWAETQPDAFSEKTGKKDVRNVYGLIGRELVTWFTHIQHTPGKSVWIVGGLDAKLDDYNRPTFVPQIEGAQAALKLPGIFDEIISMVELKTEDGNPYRAFVTQLVNPWGYPAKDRSGRLDMVEQPHLGNLMAKISGPVKPIKERLNYVMPTIKEKEEEAANV